MRQFWTIREELPTDGRLVFYGGCIVVPQAARHTDMAKLHAVHQGIKRTKRCAQHILYWLGINNDVIQLCQVRRPSLPNEPLQSDPLLTYVFEMVSADLETAPTGDLKCEPFLRGLLELRNTLDVTDRDRVWSPAAVNPARSSIIFLPEVEDGHGVLGPPGCARRGCEGVPRMVLLYLIHPEPNTTGAMFVDGFVPYVFLNHSSDCDKIS